MYTLFGSRGSGSAAVEAALTLAAVPFKTVRASEWEADSAQPELRRLNPLGQIPTLVLPDGSVMTESAAILVHLGLVHDTCGLLPTEPAARAQVMRGLVYIAANCYAAISIIDYPARWLADASDAAQDNLRQGARARLHHHWTLFAQQFAPLIGAATAPSALDLLAAVVSRWSGARAHLQATQPALHAALQQVEHHAAVAPVFKAHWPKSA